MTLSHMASAKEGGVPGVIELPWPWPPKSVITVHERRLEDGVLLTLIDPSGQMGVQIRSANRTLELLSCPLKQPHRTATTFCINWRDGVLDLYLNGTLVGTSDETKKIPEEFIFAPPNPSAKLHDFSGENHAAMSRRRSTMGGTHPRHNRERADDAYIFNGLK